MTKHDPPDFLNLIPQVYLEGEHPGDVKPLMTFGQLLLIPRGKMGAYVGEPGAGKTQAIVQLAVSIASGTEWLDTFRPAVIGSVALLLAEEELEDVGRRLYHSLPEDRSVSEHIWSSHACIPLARAETIAVRDGDLSTTIRALNPTQEYDQLTSELQSIEGLRLIVVDPWARFVQSDEIENSSAFTTSFFQLLERWCQFPSRPTVILVHHMSKAGSSNPEDQYAGRGSSAFQGAIRFQINQWADEDFVYLKLAKSTYGPRLQTFGFRWGEGGRIEYKGG